MHNQRISYATPIFQNDMDSSNLWSFKGQSQTSFYTDISNSNTDISVYKLEISAFKMQAYMAIRLGLYPYIYNLNAFTEKH